jgi:hypothetical protein
MGNADKDLKFKKNCAAIEPGSLNRKVAYPRFMQGRSLPCPDSSGTHEPRRPLSGGVFLMQPCKDGGVPE